MASNSDLEILEMWKELCALECSLNTPSQDENAGMWDRYDELFAAIAAYDACSPVGVMVKLVVAGAPVLEESYECDTEESEMFKSAIKTASYLLRKNHLSLFNIPVSSV